MRVRRSCWRDRRLHRDARQADDRAEDLLTFRWRRRARGRTCGRPDRRTARAWAACPGRRRSTARSAPCTQSWFIVMIWFSACSSVTPSRLTVAGRSANSRSKLTLMPVALPIAFRMSRSADVVEMEVQRLARRRIEHRLGRRGARALAQLPDRRLGPRRLDAVADGAIELGHLRGRGAVARIVVARLPGTRRAPPRAGPSFSNSCAFSRCARDAACMRALQCNLVVGVVGRRLQRLAVRGHRLVEMAVAHRRVALTERRARRAARRDERERNRQRGARMLKPARDSVARNLQSAFRNPQFVIDSCKPNRLPAAAICVRDLDRLYADLQNPIPARRRSRLRVRRTAPPGHRSAPPCLLGAVPTMPMNFSVIGAHRRRLRRTRRHRRCWRRRRSRRSGRRRRRRLRLESEQIRVLRLSGLRPLTVERVQMHARAAAGAACAPAPRRSPPCRLDAAAAPQPCGHILTITTAHEDDHETGEHEPGGCAQLPLAPSR